MTVSAHAKLNLTLEVVGKRNDGYHDIASIIQTIDLRDTLSFQPDQDIKLICNKPELNSSDNLVIRAAKLLQETTNCQQGVTISLHKEIPAASGMGGGSSDAAATLMALNQLWGLELPQQQLHHLASALSFDVPFFLYGGTALAEGRGDWITPLPPLPSSWLVLLHSAIDIPRKTQKLYASVNPSHFTSGELTHKAAERLRRGDKLSAFSYYNAFESVAFSLFPGLEEYRKSFIAAGATTVHLAGSGPTLFTVVKDKTAGKTIYRRLKQKGMEAYLTRTSNPTLPSPIP